MMNRVLPALVLMTIILPPLALYGDANVLTNPGFESGTTGWTARGGGVSITAVTSPVNSGEAGAFVDNRTSSWHGIQQDMLNKMVEGQTYQVAAYVRTNSAADLNVVVTFQQTDGGNDGNTQYKRTASGNADNSGWTYVSGTFTLDVTGTLTQLLIYVESDDDTVDLYVDDVVVYGPEVNPADPEADGAVDINTRRQVIEGFGAAGGWYEGWITAHPQKETLYDIFFDELGLDIYRLRNAYDQGTDGTTYMTRSGQIVAEGKERNPNLKILISAWSPPAYLKSNGLISGGEGSNATLIGGPNNYNYTGFADWWADSITAWSDDYGIDADYISIQNEPDYDATWDSCRFEPTETSQIAGYAQAFEAVYTEMDSRFGASMPNMLGPEMTGLSRLGEYLSAIINTSHLYGYAHHLYNCSNGGSAGCGDDPDLYLTNMQNIGSTWNDKPLFQTEYEHATGLWPDAYNMALLLHNALTVEGVSSYFYWSLFWAEPSGLVSLPAYGSSEYTRTSDFYGFKQYSAFIHSDWQRVDTTEDSSALRMSAYISPDNTQLTVVIINTHASTDIDLTLSLGDLTIDAGDIYRTSQTENCVNVGAFNPANPVALPAKSVTTLALTLDTTPPIYGDFDDSGLVDIDDLPEFALVWQTTDCGELDLDGDCRIGLYEFAQFARNWMNGSL